MCLQSLGVSWPDTALTILLAPSESSESSWPSHGKPDTNEKPRPPNAATVEEQNRLWLIPFPGKRLRLFRISLNYQPVCIKLPFKKCPQIKYFPINLRHKLLFFSVFNQKPFLSHFHTSGTPTRREGIARKQRFPIPPPFFFNSVTLLHRATMTN